MKNFALVALLAATFGLAVLAFHQRSQLTELRTRLAAAEAQSKTADSPPAEGDDAAARALLAERKAKALQETLTESSAKQMEKVSELQQSLEAAKTNGNNNGFAALFKQPEMKEMIKAQQKMVFGPLIDKVYGDLFQQLTPEQSAQVKELLQKKMLAASEIGMSMLDGSADAAKRQEMSKQIKAENDAVDAQIKELLGDERFKEFQTYEKSAGDRMVVGQFRDQLASGGDALEATQVKQLIDVMQEENSAFKWTTNPKKYESPDGTDFNELFNDDRLARLAAEKETLDRQVLDRARQILAPGQLDQFEKFQAAQRQMQIAAMKIAAKMFGGKAP